MTTKCSHRFCEECIKETIRQNGKCPLCNKILNNQDLVRDHNFDCLLGGLLCKEFLFFKPLFRGFQNSKRKKNSKSFRPLER